MNIKLPQAIGHLNNHHGIGWCHHQHGWLQTLSDSLTEFGCLEVRVFGSQTCRFETPRRCLPQTTTISYTQPPSEISVTKLRAGWWFGPLWNYRSVGMMEMPNRWKNKNMATKPPTRKDFTDKKDFSQCHGLLTDAMTAARPCLKGAPSIHTQLSAFLPRSLMLLGGSVWIFVRWKRGDQEVKNDFPDLPSPTTVIEIVVSPCHVCLQCHQAASRLKMA